MSELHTFVFINNTPLDQFATPRKLSVSQVFFSFYKRLYYYKVTMNLKEQSLPPLWQSSKRGALSKLIHATYNTL